MTFRLVGEVGRGRDGVVDVDMICIELVGEG